LHHAGCGFVRWQTLQGEGQILLFVKHWRTNTIISKVLRIAISWCQWQSGLSSSILLDTKTPLPHLASRWIASLRRFLRHISASLRLSHPAVTLPERTSDIYIMEHAIRCKLFDCDDVRIINYCRQYLHVTTVSELFDASGLKLLPHILKCQRAPWQDATQYIILQHRPSDYQIRTRWLRFLRQFSNNDNTIKTSSALGTWSHTGIQLRSRRESYLSTESRLYHWHEGCYWDLRLSRTTPSYYNRHTSTTWQPDNSAVPIQIQRIPQKDGPDMYYPTFLPHHNLDTTAPTPNTPVPT
jgi:hypothetical protein